MKTPAATLAQRAGYLYRHLLLLQRLFQSPQDIDGADWPVEADGTEELAIRAGIHEVLDELAEHARVLTTVPVPLKDWRPGDGPDDERWRALTEVERREVLSLLSAYENLIAWAEGQTIPQGALERSESSPAEAFGRLRALPRGANDPVDYLKAERARVARFRRDMNFLDRRRVPEAT